MDVKNNQEALPERDWSVILLLVLFFSLIPLWLFSGLLWFAFAWGAILVGLLRYQPRTKQALESIFGRRLRMGTALLLILNVALSFVIIHETVYAGNLQWGVEEGDQFSYSIEAVGYYISDYEHPCIELNNSIVFFEIVSLPSIPLYCDRVMFIDSIVDPIKTSVSFENGSSLDSDIASVLTTLFSNSFLPIGDWVFIDGLYYDRARGGLGAQVQDPWFSRFEGNTFCFGEVHITCVGAPGWNAEISLEDGVPIVIRDMPNDWGGVTIILTRN